MSVENTIHVIKTIFDGEGLKQYTQSLNKAEEESRQFSRTLSQEAQLVSTSQKKSFNEAGQSVARTTSLFQDQGKTVSVVTENINGKVGLISESVKEQGKSFATTHPRINEYVKALQRVAIVVPVWAATRAIMQGFTNTVQESVRFLVDWEYQMAQMKIVGAGSETQLKALSNALLNLSSSLGISNKDIGEGAKLYIQQGRAIQEIIPLMDATAKLSLLTGNTVVQSVEDLTAVLSAYKLEARDAINVINTISNVELQHSITARDLAQAYKAVASTASSLGVSLSALTGYITAIKDSTRDSGNKIGLSLRTMFTRISTSSAESIQKLTGIPLYLTKTGNVTRQITPNMRNLEEIIYEISLAFGQLTEAQKAQLAQLVGGTQRINQAMALFNNFTKAVEAQADAMFGLGKANRAVNILLDTTKIKAEQLTSSWAELVNALLKTDAFKNVQNALINITRYLTFLANEKQFLNVEVAKRYTEQINTLSERIKFVKSLMEVLAKSKSLDQLIARNPANVDQATKAIEIYVKKINQASKEGGFGFEIPVTVKTPEDLTKFLQQQMPNLKNQSIEWKIRADTNAAQIEIANLSTALSKVVNEGEMNFALKYDLRSSDRTLQELRKQAEISLSRLKIGELLDPSAITNLKRFFLEIENKGIFQPKPEQKQQIIGLLDEIQKKTVSISNIEQQRNQYADELNEKEKELLDNTSERLRLETSVAARMSELKIAGASELQIAIAQLAYLDKIGIKEDERAKQVQKINELQAELSSNILKEIFDSTTSILTLNGQNEVNILRANLELEKRLGIEKSGLEALKERLTLAQAIAKEEKASKEDKLTALQNEIKLQTKLQNPEYQRQLQKRQDTLTKQAEKLGIDVTKFFPQIPNKQEVFQGMEFSVPEYLKNLTTNQTPFDINQLSSSIDSLVSEMKNQQVGQAQNTFNVDVGGISVQVMNLNKQAILDAIKMEIDKPNSALNQIVNKQIEEF